MRSALALVILATALALAGCRQAEAPAPAPTGNASPATAASPSSSTAAPSAAPEATEPYALSPLQDGDYRGRQTDVGGCVFADTDKRHLMIVGNPDDPKLKAVAVARVDGRVVRPVADAAGGTFERERIAMAFEGVRFVLTHPAGPGRPIGIETTAWPATLTIGDADGEGRTYRGEWSCGV